MNAASGRRGSGHRIQHIAEIQGIRAIAVVVVVLFHARFTEFSGGFVGVDVFFVISGYLISRLLMGELQQTGSIDFQRFYAQRLKRLLPAALLVTVSVLILCWLIYSPLEMRIAASSAFAATAYLSNVRYAIAATDYLGGHAETDPYLHTWSLAVEEQFYLVWPLLLYLLWRLGKSPSAWRGVVLLTTGSLALCVSLSWNHQPIAYFSLPTRAWQFGMGACIALAPFVATGNRRWLGPTFALAGICCILLATATFTKGTVYPGYAAMLPTAGAALLLYSYHNNVQNWLSPALTNYPMKKLGELSYSLYLWHWPVFVALFDYFGNPNTLQTCIAIALSLVLAQLTFWAVEDPLRKRSFDFGKVLFAAAIVTVLVAALAIGVRYSATQAATTAVQQRYLDAVEDGHTFLAEQGCYAQYGDVDALSCEIGAGSQRVVLFGDSHAAHWIHALVPLTEKYDLRIIPLLKSACPSILFEPFDVNLGRPYHECTTWRENAMQKIERLQPDIIILSDAAYYWDPGYRHATFGDGDWATALANTLKRLQPLSSKVVVFRDTADAKFNIPRCLARQASARLSLFTRNCSFTRADPVYREVHQQTLDALQRFPQVAYLATDRIACPEAICQAESNGVIHYTDSHHLSATYGRSLGNKLESALREAQVLD